jgi:hypothetical protein
MQTAGLYVFLLGTSEGASFFKYFPVVVPLEFHVLGSFFFVNIFLVTWINCETNKN